MSNQPPVLEKAVEWGVAQMQQGQMFIGLFVICIVGCYFAFRYLVNTNQAIVRRHEQITDQARQDILALHEKSEATNERTIATLATNNTLLNRIDQTLTDTGECMRECTEFLKRAQR